MQLGAFAVGSQFGERVELVLYSPMERTLFAAFSSIQDDAARVREAYRRAYTRAATEAEVGRALKYLADSGAGTETKKLKAWQGLCRVLLASAEFAFVE